MEVVDEFCYLGSYISHNGNCEKEVKVRIGIWKSIICIRQDEEGLGEQAH